MRIVDDLISQLLPKWQNVIILDKISLAENKQKCICPLRTTTEITSPTRTFSAAVLFHWWSHIADLLLVFLLNSFFFSENCMKNCPIMNNRKGWVKVRVFALIPFVSRSCFCKLGMRRYCIYWSLFVELDRVCSYMWADAHQKRKAWNCEKL